MRSDFAMAREHIRDHLETVLSSAVFRGSTRHVELLRYLVERSLADQTTHEVDIAVDVFGKDQTYDPTESSSVRVCIHQLRKKLDEYYLTDGRGSDFRLSIPKGSYRVSFGTPLAEAGPVAAIAGRGARARLGRVPVTTALLLLVASLAMNGILLSQRSQVPAPKDTPSHLPELFAWQGLVEGQEPILIAVGDVFFFTEKDESGSTRYVRDIAINSLRDLREAEADRYGSAVLPSELTYVPKAAAFALERILPVAMATGKPISLKLMSEVTGQDLRENDVIYIGLLRSMGALHEYFFRMSNFSIAPPYLRLLQKDTGKAFRWSGTLFGPTHDYGLFSKLQGPDKGDLVVFTGLSGIGMLQAVRTMTDPVSARAVERDVRRRLNGIPPGVEILFQAAGYDRVGVDAKVAGAKAVRQDGTG